MAQLAAFVPPVPLQPSPAVSLSSSSRPRAGVTRSPEQLRALAAISVAAAAVSAKKLGRRPALKARMRDTDEAMTAAEFEDEKEAQLAVLKLMEETRQLEETLGRSAESRLFGAVQMEAAGTTLAQKVENMLTVDYRLLSPSQGPTDPSRPFPCVAVCCSSNNPVALEVQRLLGQRGAGGPPACIDLASSKEALSSAFKDAEVVVICPDLSLEDAAPESKKLPGQVRTVLEALPLTVRRVFLLSRSGKPPASQDLGPLSGLFNLFSSPQTSSWAEAAKELRESSLARQGRAFLVEAELATTNMAPGRVCCRALLEETGATPAPAAPTQIAEALLQAAWHQVDIGFQVWTEPEEAATLPDWPELMAPLVGPEVWRTTAAEARRATAVAQSWAESLLEEGAGRPAGSQQMGFDTMLDVKRVPGGVQIKYRPKGTPADLAFDKLEAGGLELVSEMAIGNRPARLRCRRLPGPTRERTEKSLLSMLNKAWQENLKK